VRIKTIDELVPSIFQGELEGERRILLRRSAKKWQNVLSQVLGVAVQKIVYFEYDTMIDKRKRLSRGCK